jgi:hypothetical protein
MSATVSGLGAASGAREVFRSAPIGTNALNVFIKEVAAAAVGDQLPPTEIVDLVTDAVQAFLETNAAPQIAARRVKRQLRHLGAKQPQEHLDARDLRRAFEHAQSVALVAARRHFEAHLTHDEVLEILNRIAEYLRLLHDQAHRGLTETSRLLSLTAEDQHTELRRALFHTTEPIDLLAMLTGHDAMAVYRPVVAVDGLLPDSITQAPGAIVGNACEALVSPETLEDRDLCGELTHLVAVGPAVSLESMPESIDLARRAARLLQSGRASHPGPMVPCSDLVAELAVAGSPLLSQLAAHQCVGPLMDLRASQRTGYMQLLLCWLEQGPPLSRVAAGLHMPPQTAHHRFSVLRRMYGERLEHPNGRLELLVALRHLLPRWQRAEGVDIPDSRHPIGGPHRLRAPAPASHEGEHDR